MDDIRKYINIVTEARLPGRLTYRPTDLEEPEDSAEIADLVKQAFNKADPSPNPEEVVARKDLRRVLIQALKKLPKRDAMIFVWYAVDGMLPGQISIEKFKNRADIGKIWRSIWHTMRRLKADPDLKKYI